jgi:crotonobetainyl-CoA:carnitine CoA-transferase CaiB-like acyl-CoA transferase
VAVDLKSKEGLGIVRELIATADVVVENFSTGVMQRFSLDYESCRKLKLEINYCSISAYGPSASIRSRRSKAASCP